MQLNGQFLISGVPGLLEGNDSAQCKGNFKL